MSSSTELRVKELLRERGWTTKVLAEKTGMSESYLTHIKNGTRRWNEDALRKLSDAFNLHPIEMFAQRKNRTDNLENNVEVLEETTVDLKLKIVPVMGDIPTNPSPYNNQIMQVTSGYKDVFIPVFNNKDDSMFCLSLENNSMAPIFAKGDYLIISPETWTRSGDIAAVEYGNDVPVKAIMQVSYMDEFVVLESVNHKQPPVAIVKGKDHFRIIGKLIQRSQKLS
jgi:phage repressor protein C with HTH and peptisase S24 domain